MRQMLGDHIAACRERAEACRSRANECQEAAMKEGYLDLAQRWEDLVEAYEFLAARELALMGVQNHGWPFDVEKLPKGPKAFR
jgi:hypothetical protein